ncbi:hypothetical protein EmuJ_000686200 [Echinococcus multilocularis]|uniref:Uncharacterized protein n=1 Tax=Echinococcus multilocularis TaxID=6211 RepID=A0A068YAW3_ECHMU|nr:hypothetical protein EmuJ_000686200 [Echinococcus multilocularis]
MNKAIEEEKEVPQFTYLAQPMRLSDPQSIPSMPKPIAFMPAVLSTCTRESRRGEIYAFTLSLPCPAVCFFACPSLCLVYCLLKLGDFVDQSHALWTALHSGSEHFSVTFTYRSTWTFNLFGEEKQLSASVYYETVAPQAQPSRWMDAACATTLLMTKPLLS